MHEREGPGNWDRYVRWLKSIRSEEEVLCVSECVCVAVSALTN